MVWTRLRVCTPRVYAGRGEYPEKVGMLQQAGGRVADEWIRMRLDLAEDPAVISMAGALSVHETHVVGMLHKAWCWADKHTQNGHAKGVTTSWLDRYIGVTGFSNAMIDCGWLIEKDGLKFPNFDRHNGESAKKRGKAAERKRLQRDRESRVTKKSHEKRDNSVTRGEERRVLKEKDTTPPAAFVLPDWVPAENWAGWMEIREKKKIPNTLRAMSLAVGKLLMLKGKGFDPGVVLDEACLKGWRGIFEPTPGFSRPGAPPPPENPLAGTIECEDCHNRVRNYTGRKCVPCYRGRTDVPAAQTKPLRAVA